jgi:DNA polymerase-3 subunit gamma/tau
MRDGLSLLDQAIVFGNGKVLSEDVNAMLGTVAQQPVEDLLTALAKNDATALLDKIEEIANIQPDFTGVLQQILQVLHRIALVQQIPSTVVTDFDADMIAALAPQFTAEDVQLYYQIGLVGQRDLDLAPDPRSGFEMVMLRMLMFKPVAIEATAQTKPEQVKLPNSKLGTQAQYKRAINDPPPAIAEKKNDAAHLPNIVWADMVVAMNIKGLTRELANNCVLKAIDDKICTLVLDPGHNHLLTSRAQESLQKTLQTYRGAPLKLSFISEKPITDTPAVLETKEREDKQQAAIDAIHSDQNIQALKEHFGARVMPGTIEPV